MFGIHLFPEKVKTLFTNFIFCVKMRKKGGITVKVRICLQEENGLMNYAIHYPEDYQDLPLLVYLHGAGERGGNFRHVYRHGVPKLLEEGQQLNAVVLIPQCPVDLVWDNIVQDLKKVIDIVAADFNILPDRICLTGSSMGGFGTWMMGITYPALFSAIAPIAGGNMTWRACRLVNTPVYALHGAEDTAVVPMYSQLMCDAIAAKGGQVKLTIMEGFGHNDGIDHAYRDLDVIEWLLKQRRSDFTVPPDHCSQYY